MAALEDWIVTVRRVPISTKIRVEKIPIPVSGSKNTKMPASNPGTLFLRASSPINSNPKPIKNSPRDRILSDLKNSIGKPKAIIGRL
jgi:hypothetical protein